MRPKILILNGPNLNLLGLRQPEIYGRETLADVEASCRGLAGEFDLDLEFKQSNGEHQLLDWIHAARRNSESAAAQTDSTPPAMLAATIHASVMGAGIVRVYTNHTAAAMRSLALSLR